MKYSTAQAGRVFVLRLEDGEIIHETIESFAKKLGIKAGSLIMVGGSEKGSKIVVGPENGKARPVNPMEYILEDVHEIAGVGTLFPDIKGNTILHAHCTFGRDSHSHTGCIRRGVRVWCVLEVIITELVDSVAVRKTDTETGFEILNPNSSG